MQSTHIHLLITYMIYIYTMRRLACRSLSTLSPPHTPKHSSDLFHSNKKIAYLCSLGHVTDARKVFDEMPKKDSVSWNSMITGYARNRHLDDAKSLFDAFSGKNVRTWTAMLTGYAKNGLILEAYRVFNAMPERNIVSWNAMISGFVQIGDLCGARKIFDLMGEKNVSSWNSVITGYCQFRLIDEARELFDRMPERNYVSWTVMINGYVQISDFNEAWRLFLQMFRSGVRLEQSIFVVGVSVIAGLNDLSLIGSLMSIMIKIGYDGDVVINTTILDVFTRSGSLDMAFMFFNSIPEHNEYSWTCMIAAFSKSGRLNDAIALYEKVRPKSVSIQTAILAAYSNSGRISEARNIFDEIRKPNVVAWNAIVSGYAQNGMIEEAKNLFSKIPFKNSASWGAMIAGLVQNGHGDMALELLSELHRLGSIPSHSSFTSALSACSNTGALEMGRQIHTLSIKSGCQFNSYVGNALMYLYAKGKMIEDVTRVFSRLRETDIVSWNSLLACFSKNHMLDNARNIFEKMPDRDVVSWTTIIFAYLQDGYKEIALQLFFDMLADGMKPNELTLTSLLSSVETPDASKIGKQIHGMVFKLGFNSYTCICRSLVKMYFKCGYEDGFLLISDMTEQNDVSKNAVLAGCVKNGLADNSVEFFQKINVDV